MIDSSTTGIVARVQPEPSRVVALNGTRKLRDLGGYPTVDGRRTRWRTLYRSDCLDQVDEAGQAWLIDAGLRTIIDLRGEEEAAARPYAFGTSKRVTYRLMPFFDQELPADSVPDLTNGYLRLLSLCGERLRTIFEALLAPEALPALIHCAAGKDRTGVAVGLVLEAVGVIREAICQDYALSSTCLGPEYLAECRAWVAERGRDLALWAHTFETPPERMLATLDHLDRQYGGIEGYLVRHGLRADQFKQLRGLLLADGWPHRGRSKGLA